MEQNSIIEGFIKNYKPNGFGFFEDDTFFHINDVINARDYIYLDTLNYRYKASYEKYPSSRIPGKYEAKRVTIISNEPKNRESSEYKDEGNLEVLAEQHVDVKSPEENEGSGHKADLAEGTIIYYDSDKKLGFFNDGTVFHISSIQNENDSVIDTEKFCYKASYEKAQVSIDPQLFVANRISILSEEQKAVINALAVSEKEEPVTPYNNLAFENIELSASDDRKQKQSNSRYINNRNDSVVMGNENLTDEIKDKIYLLLKRYFSDGETISLVDIGNLFSRNSIFPNTYGFQKLSSLCWKLEYLDVENRKISGGGSQSYATFHWRKDVIEAVSDSSDSKHPQDEAAYNIPRKIIQPGIHKDATFNDLDAAEKRIIKAFSDIFFITFGGHNVNFSGKFDSRSLKSNWKYSFMRPTDNFGEKFNLDKELVLVFSSYNRFETSSFGALSRVYEYNEQRSPFRLERICSVMVSKDPNVVQKVKDSLKVVNTEKQFVVIPFSYDEIIEKHEELGREDWMEFVTQRFRDFFYDRDLFSDDTPLKDEQYFFGRQTFVHELVNRHKSHLNSGVFGLRRSGKTSTLYAVQRLLKTIRKKWLWFDAQQLQHKRWNHALHFIVSHAHKEFEIDYNTDESEYDIGNASFLFERDMKELNLKMRGESLLLMIDEVEWITFGIANTEHWKEGGDFIFFWNAIKAYFHKNPEIFNFIIAGTNPRAIEAITVNGFDNPLYRQAEIKYMPPFNETETKDMINKLGGYMGLQFDNSVCNIIASDYGGQPFIIRQFCSLVNKHIMTKGLGKPLKITKPIYDEVKKEFDISGELFTYCQLILDVLITKYPDEYEILKALAISDESTINELVKDRALISHLEGYGIIELSGGQTYCFKNETIKNYLLDEGKYTRTLKTTDERIKEVHERLYNAEIKLQSVIKRVLKIYKGEADARAIIHTELAKIPENISNLEFQSFSLDDLFSRKCHKHFKNYRDLILDNWECFKRQIQSMDDFKGVMKNVINIRNNDGYHPSLETPLEEDRFILFRNAMEQLERWLKALD